MKKRVITAMLLSFMVLALFLIHNYFKCELTDNEAINTVEKFYTNLNIKYPEGSFQVKNERKTKISRVDIKKVISGNVNEYKILAEVNCKTKEVVYFANEIIMEASRNRYTITSANNTKHLKWPPFIDEKKAREILSSLANHIGLPEDAEFAELNLDRNDGIWIAKWKRKHKGIAYEKFYLTIAILAFDGELFSFNKIIEDNPYTAEVKISRQEAIAVATKKFISFFPKDKWEKNKDKFEVKSADLYYSTDIGLFYKFFHCTKPKLVWIVKFDAKGGMGNDTVEILIKDKSTIKVDPITGKILSSNIEVVR